MAHQLTAKQFPSFQKELDGISKDDGRTLQTLSGLRQQVQRNHDETRSPDRRDYKAANPTYSLSRIES